MKFLDHVSHGESLAGARGTQHHLVVITLMNAFNELSNGFRLVAGGNEWSLKFKIHMEILLFEPVDWFYYSTSVLFILFCSCIF